MFIIQKILKRLDSGFRQNDDLADFMRNSKLSIMLCNRNNFYRISGWSDKNRPMLAIKSERIDETIPWFQKFRI